VPVQERAEELQQGQSYEECLVFLVGGTGKITALEWAKDYGKDPIRWTFA
jgi:hypothetical protein